VRRRARAGKHLLVVIDVRPGAQITTVIFITICRTPVTQETAQTCLDLAFLRVTDGTDAVVASSRSKEESIMLNTPRTCTPGAAQDASMLQDDELDLVVGGLNERPIQTLHGGLFSLNRMDVIRWMDVNEFEQQTGGRPIV
jgi:hypothetical protein